MNTNPMQMLLQLIKSGHNPQQLAMTMLEQRSQNNPFMQNLLSLAKQGNTGDIEQIVRNMLKEQGYDFDKEFQNFKDTLGL